MLSPLQWSLQILVDGQPFRPYSYQGRILADKADRLLVLKARQTGISFAAAVLIAWHAVTFPHSTSLIVSRDQTAATRLLETVYEILDSLESPVDFDRRAMTGATLANGSQIISQPATSKSGRGVTASLVVLDEFAFADYDKQILRAVLPTLSRGGRLIIISTPDGVANEFYRLWADDKGDWSRHKVHWSDCPVFTSAWAEQEKAKHTAQSWASEYEADFVESGGSVFNIQDLEALRVGWEGEKPMQHDHTYVSAWDIGRRHDPTVGITIDSTAKPFQVVKYERLLRAPFAQSASAITRRVTAYPGQHFVESNNTGDPVLEMIEEKLHVQPFVTSAASKANALTSLITLVENYEIKAGSEQLLSELRGYQWEDKGLVQTP